MNSYFFISFIIYFSVSHVYSGTHSVQSENGFGSSISGLSTSENIQNLQKNHQKKTIQNLIPRYDISQTSGDSAFLKSLEWTSYKNLIHYLTTLGHLKNDQILYALQTNDFFFSNYFRHQNILQVKILETALMDLKQRMVLKNYFADFEMEALFFLKSQWSHLERQKKVMENALKNTQKIFSPHIYLSTEQFGEIKTKPAIARLKNGTTVAVLGSKNKNIYVINLETGRMLFDPIPTKGLVFSAPTIAQLENGKELAIVGSDDNLLYFIDLNSGDLLATKNLQNWIRSSATVAQLKNGKDIAIVGSDDHHVYFIDIHSRKTLFTKETTDLVRSKATVGTLRDGRNIAIFSSLSGLTYFINLDTQEYLFNPIELKPFDSTAALFWSEKWQTDIALIASDDKVHMINIHTGKKMMDPIPMSGPVFITPLLLKTNDYKNTAVICVNNSFIHILDVDTGQITNTLTTDAESINKSLNYHQMKNGEEWIIVSTDKNILYLFNLNSLNPTRLTLDSSKLSHSPPSFFSTEEKEIGIVGTGAGKFVFIDLFQIFSEQ